MKIICGLFLCLVLFTFSTLGQKNCPVISLQDVKIGLTGDDLVKIAPSTLKLSRHSKLPENQDFVSGTYFSKDGDFIMIDLYKHTVFRVSVIYENKIVLDVEKISSLLTKKFNLKGKWNHSVKTKLLELTEYNCPDYNLNVSRIELKFISTVEDNKIKKIEQQQIKAWEEKTFKP